VRRRTVAFLMAILVGCGAPAPEQRARDVASWITATSGVVASWVSGSISAAAADSNLESTARTLGDVSREGLPAPTAEALGAALRHIAEAREAVRTGDKARATAKAEDLAALARTLVKR
jgi:hypothetical protein